MQAGEGVVPHAVGGREVVERGPGYGLDVETEVGAVQKQASVGDASSLLVATIGSAVADAADDRTWPSSDGPAPARRRTGASTATPATASSLSIRVPIAPRPAAVGVEGVRTIAVRP